MGPDYLDSIPHVWQQLTLTPLRMFESQGFRCIRYEKRGVDPSTRDARGARATICDFCGDNSVIDLWHRGWYDCDCQRHASRLT